MACFFLGGSTLLPLSDFSLMQDIPDMYRNYTKITTADELGVIDFIGDYLLHGKDLFGHNEHDKPQSGADNVQFQHQANPLSIVLFTVHICVITRPEVQKAHRVCHKSITTSDYHQELLRPPLA